MLRTFWGYEVEIARQVLYSGTWDEGDWDWECERHHFFSEEDAEKDFKKQRKVAKESGVLVRMFHCEFYMDGDYVISATHGDEIKEYVWENGKIVVWKL